MYELHLVGPTTDRRGLIFRVDDEHGTHRFVVPVTDELRRLVSALGPVPTAPAEAGAVTDAAAPGVGRTESALGVREIQGRLRAGESVEDVAARAGVPESWVERFAPPVWAEHRHVVEEALSRHPVGPDGTTSDLPLGRAVALGLAERGVVLPPGTLDAGWSARFLGDHRWVVRYEQADGNATAAAEWLLDRAHHELRPVGDSAARLGVPGPAGVAPSSIPPPLRDAGRPVAPSPTPRRARACWLAGPRAVVGAVGGGVRLVRSLWRLVAAAGAPVARMGRLAARALRWLRRCPPPVSGEATPPGGR